MAMAAVVIAVGGGHGIARASMEAAIDQATRDADLVVIARVVGMIDDKPGAEARKAREAHWIDIERVLKGSDEAGQRFGAQPNGMIWQDGARYIMFLDWPYGNWVEAIPPSIAASEANVARVAVTVARQGAGVTPARVLWMRLVGGWQIAPSAEFIVGADGKFVWRERVGDNDFTVRTGALDKGAIAALIKRIAGTRPGPVVDDGGTVSFRWLDADRKPRFAQFSTPDRPPAAGLVAAIRKLAQRRGSNG